MSKDSIIVTFVGDIALHSDVAKTSMDPFQYVGDKLHLGDFLVANLESPLRGGLGENLKKRPRVIGEEENLRILEKLKPDIVSLANNHIYDALEDGYDKTITALRVRGIEHYGAGNTLEQSSRPLIIEKNNIKLGILFYLTPDTNPNLPDDCSIYLNFIDEQKVAGDISAIKKQVDICIVYIHWGVEYIHVPSPAQQQMSETLIATGADCVIGSHTHVIQPISKKGRNLVAYGLGNFYFPDFTFEGNIKHWGKSGRESLILSVGVKKDKCSIKDVTRVILRDGELYIKNGFLGFRMAFWKVLCFIYRLEPIWQARIWVFNKKSEMYWFFKRVKNFLQRKVGVLTGKR